MTFTGKYAGASILCKEAGWLKNFSCADSHIEVQEAGLEFQEFDIGDEVSFEHEGNIITGTVIRVNKKTLTVRSERGSSWYISPGLASKIPFTLKNRWS